MRYRRAVPAQTLAAAAPFRRHDRLDALRGAAIVWMAAFHFGFDLNHFGFIQQNFYTDPLWTVQRTCIVSAVPVLRRPRPGGRAAPGQGWPRFWRRWAQVAGCAVLVTIGSC